LVLVSYIFPYCPEPTLDYEKLEKTTGRKKLVLLMTIACIVIVSPKEYWYRKMITKDVTGNFLESTTCPYSYLEIYPKLCKKGNQMK